MPFSYKALSGILLGLLIVSLILLFVCQGRIVLWNKDKFTLKELPKLEPEPLIDVAQNFQEIEEDMSKPPTSDEIQFTPREFDYQDLDNRIATKQYDLGQNTVKNMAYSVSFNDKEKFRKYFDQELRNQSMREWISVDQIYTKV